jgi:uncharacterized protein YndB with AHSA1/START domain
MNRYLFTIVTGLLIATIIISMGFIRKKSGGQHEAENYSSTPKSNAMTNDTSVTHNVNLTRIFNAPLSSVWKAWSDAESVMKWWGPTGFTSPLCNMDFQEGKTTLVCMRAPKEYGGQDMYNTWTYTKIIPMERIEFTLHFSDKDGNKLNPAEMGMPPGIPSGVPHLITLRPLNDNSTEITVTEYGYTTRQAHDISKTGLEQCLDKMAHMLK